ncbi:VHS domain-containing protein [Phlyctochytrium arcticum]|nr:VHS domain-containing protein [Phlyctochytrium arcticum]
MTSFMTMEQLVDQICDSEYPEPNVALMLEICDMINRKGRSLPRECAFTIVANINSRSQQSAMHALTLLDYCVKNCGYPFHLIISTKEFLNELVRRFPERPGNVNLVHHRILELIQVWNATLCVTSRYKDDFKHINDMYRLLSYKGYRFPQMARDAGAGLNPTESFKTEEELENEDKVAQGAKLQELLRMGTPAALEQANDLMKIMSGYDTERIPNYKKQVEEEINRIEQRTILLNDILIQKSPDERYRPDSTVDELVSSAKSAQSRIQKLLSEGEEDERTAFGGGNLGRLLELNDLINTVLTKHHDFKAGKPVQGAVEKSNISSAISQANQNQAQPGAISLIDFDDFGTSPAATTSATSPSAYMSAPQSQGHSQQAAGQTSSSYGGSLLDDLGSLNFTSTPSNNQSANNTISGFGAPLIDAPQSSPIGHTMAQNSGRSTPTMGGFQHAGLSQSLPQQILRTQSPAPAGVNQFLANGGASPANTPQGMNTPQSRPMQSSTNWNSGPAVSTPSSTQKPDPFGGVDLFGSVQPATPPPGTPPVGGAGLGQQQQAKETMIYDKNGLQIKYQVAWKGNAYSAKATFINVTPVPFTNLMFQVAVPKSMTLNMEPASGTVIAPLNQSQVLQGMQILNPQKPNPFDDTQEQLRLRFKVQYAVNGAVVNEQGEYHDV